MKKRINACAAVLAAALLAGCGAAVPDTLPAGSGQTSSSVQGTQQTAAADGLTGASDSAAAETSGDPFASVNQNDYLSQEYSGVRVISYSEAEKKLAQGDTFVLYIGRTSCKWCRNVYPQLGQTTHSGLDVYYVNVEYFRDAYPDDKTSAAFAAVKKVHQEFKKEFMYSSLPCLRYIKNGKVVQGIENPLNGAFFADDATDEKRSGYLTECRNSLQEFLGKCADGGAGFTDADASVWKKTQASVRQDFADDAASDASAAAAAAGEDADGGAAVSDASEAGSGSGAISQAQLWALEKKYGKRLAADGEESYWDTVNEQPHPEN